MSKKETINLSGQLKKEWERGNYALVFEQLEQVVASKIKFPSLERLAVFLHEWLPQDSTQVVIQKVIGMDQIGSYPFCGKLIQLEMAKGLLPAFRLAAKSIHEGDVWYACDTISERVYGVGLLDYWDDAYPLLEKLLKSNNKWDRRGVGVATHLAVKWGLDREKSAILLRLALSRKHATNHEEKTGIGWGMKTLAKFHPELFVNAGLEKGHGLPAWMAAKVKKGMAIAEIRAAKLRQSKG